MHIRLVLAATALVVANVLSGCASYPIACTIEEREEKQSVNLPIIGEITTQEKEDDFDCGIHNVEVTELPENVVLDKGVNLTKVGIGGQATLVGLDKDGKAVTFYGQTDD